MTEKAPALEARSLRYAYPNGPRALDGLDLSVAPGEKLGVIGPNGAGKTTLFMAACGVLKPSAGEILAFGHRVVPGEFRPEVGMVFQSPDDQVFCPSVAEDVAFGPENMGLSRAEVDDRVEAALKTTGTTDLADRAPHRLSGGEKRMVAIAGILAMSPGLIIYDEPSANLDIRSRRRLIEFLRTSRQTLLVSSHDLELVLELCDRAALMDGGRLVASGPPREVMNDEQLMQTHGLERPHSLTPHLDHQSQG